MHLEALDHVGLAVADVARSVAWYTDVLGLRRVHEQAWGDFPAVLEANGSGIALFPRTDGHSIGPDDPLRHVGFRTSRAELEQARAELTARGMPFDAGDYGIAWSLYFPDPDGYLVEITTYDPPGDDTEPSERGRAGPGG
jgi:catechol 2,3-dioxygenase-like lactoylglutathione lyase family enzyme